MATSSTAADTRPAVDRGITFDECLSFTVHGPWAHFRRVEGNIVKQTYQIMPRTTIAGFIAAVLGLERNSYYDLFDPNSSAIAIEPTTELRTINMPVNSLSTNKNARIAVPSRRKTSANVRVEYPDSTQNRQQHNYEVLVDPAYRVDMWLDDTETYNALRTRLENGESYYSPSLGLSEHLAAIDYHGTHEVTHETRETADVDSAVPGTSAEIIPSSGVRYKTERSPGFMRAERSGPQVQRTTTGFINWIHTAGDDAPLTVTEKPISTVDNRAVVFV